MADSSVAKQRAANTPKLGTTELLYGRAFAMNLQPAWIIPGSLFAVTLGGRELYLSLAQSPLNSHASISLAKDKYFTRRILERNGIPNIPFMRPSTRGEAEAFLATQGTIVAKPVDGAGAQDIHIVTDVTQLRGLRISNYILEKYIRGQEMRYLILNGSVIGVHRSDYGTSVDAHRELERISLPSEEWDEMLVESSLHIAQVMDLDFAAVDYLVDDAGQAHLLEVNTMPGMKWFHAPSSGPAVDVAGLFLEAIVRNERSARESQYDTTSPLLTGEL